MFYSYSNDEFQYTHNLDDIRKELEILTGDVFFKPA